MAGETQLVTSNTARANIHARRTEEGTRKMLGNLVQIQLRLLQLRKDDSELVAKLTSPSTNGSRELLESQRREISGQIARLEDAQRTLRKTSAYAGHVLRERMRQEEWMHRECIAYVEPWERAYYPPGY